jgi:Dolichyl-phosphate-mannose-protein mannosyltransferase
MVVWEGLRFATGRGATGDSALASEVDNARFARWITWFIVLGLVVRGLRYVLRFPLWDDESFLCVNLIDRSFAELARPLDFHQVAPLLFLWMERGAVRLLGFSELVLRLVPFIVAVASLFVFRRTASRLLSGAALLLAVAVFAVSYPCVRYAAEAKPYGTDLFVSLVILGLTVEWLARRESRWLWGLACLMPLAVGISYPAIFTAGGLSLVVGACLWRERGTRPEWRAWICWTLALVASFGVWFSTSGHVQAQAEDGFMTSYWDRNFPPVTQPWKLPLWILQTHASDFLAYPVGGPNWGSTLSLLFVLAGLWRLARQGNRIGLGLCLAPAGLQFLAAAMHKYPYGGHVKFSQYLAPQICCLVALGIVQTLEWCSARGFSWRRGLACSCAVLAAIGVVIGVRDVARPYKTASDYRSRAFAESFWFSTSRSEEVACLKTDLGLDFVPEQHRDLSWAAQYLCNRAIEVSRYHLPRPDFNRVSRERPLRCVLYRESRFPFEQARFDRWLVEMQERYELVGHESVSLPRCRQDDRTLIAVELVESYKFVPRNPSHPAPAPTLAEGRQKRTRE